MFAFNAGIGIPDVVNGTAQCGFGSAKTGAFFALATAPEKDDTVAFLASQSVVNVKRGSRIQFFCNTSGNQITISSVVGIHLIITPVNGFAAAELGSPIP